MKKNKVDPTVLFIVCKNYYQHLKITKFNKYIIIKLLSKNESKSAEMFLILFYRNFFQ